MGQALALIGGSITGTEATPTAVTPLTGDTFNVASFNTPDLAYLENIWARQATPGLVRYRSPRLHDFNQGLRLQNPAATPYELMPYGANQLLYSSDTPTVELQGGAASEVDEVFALYGYTNLPGVAAVFESWAAVQGSIQNISGAEIDVSTSATAGQWGAGVPLTTTFDNWKAGHSYAILGFVTNVAVGAVGFIGPDTGNYRVGGPGPVDSLRTRRFFQTLSIDSGRNYIPIIQANNAAATSLQVADPAVSAAVRVSLIAADLG